MSSAAYMPEEGIDSLKRMAPNESSRSRSRSRSISGHSRRSYSRSSSGSRSRSPRRQVYRHERRPLRSSTAPYRAPTSSTTSAPSEPSTILGVFGLALSTTEKELSSVYSSYGSVTNVTLIYDHETNKSRGFGFINFSSVEDAKQALEATNGMTLDGRTIRVDYSLTKGPHAPTPGKYMGLKPKWDYRHRSRSRSRSGRHSHRRSSYSRSRSRSYSRSPRRSHRHRHGYRRHSHSRSRSR